MNLEDQNFLYKHIITKLDQLENKIDRVELRLDDRLRTEVKEIRQDLEEKIKVFHTDLLNIQKKIENLDSFKFKVIGASGVLSFIITLAVTIFF